MKNSLKKALKDEKLQKELLLNFNTKGVYLPYPLVADTAFTKSNLKACNRLIAMYHDLGLAPLKALYFEKKYQCEFKFAHYTRKC